MPFKCRRAFEKREPRKRASRFPFLDQHRLSDGTTFPFSDVDRAGVLFRRWWSLLQWRHILGTTIGHLDSCRGITTVVSAGNLSDLIFFLLVVIAFAVNGVGGSFLGRTAENVISQVRLFVFALCVRRIFHSILLMLGPWQLASCFSLSIPQN